MRQSLQLMSTTIVVFFINGPFQKFESSFQICSAKSFAAVCGWYKIKETQVCKLQACP